MSFMPFFLMVIRVVLAEDLPIVENIDRIIDGQRFSLSCPIKTISQTGMFRWSFEPYNKKLSQVICTKNPHKPDCEKSKSDPWLNGIEIISLNIFIEKITSKYAGTYQCQYMDERSIDRHFFKVTILTPPGKPEIFTNPNIFTENSMVELTCISEGGNPKPTLKWLWKDFSNFPVSRERRINSTLTQSNNTFGITNLTSHWIPRSFEDGNSISCQSQNSLATVSSNWKYLSVNYAPIIYDFPSKTFYGLAGSDVNIECKASSKSTATFKWVTEKGRTVSDRSYLIINPLRTSDKGSYSCVVTNSFGTASATLDIRVLSAPIIDVPRSVTVNEYETLDLACSVVPSMSNVTWWLDNRVISTTSDLRLEIKRKQSFEIQCQASVFIKLPSGHATVVSNMKTVTVIVQHIPQKPTISANPGGTLLLGADVTLTCVANKTKPGLPKPYYSWRKYNSDWIKNDTNFLTLPSLKFEDAGIYACRLRNKLGFSEENSYNLIVEGQPIINGMKTTSPKSLYIREGRSFKIECRYQGKPHPTIKWYRDDILIIVNGNMTRFNVESHLKNSPWFISTLYVDELDVHSDEIYRCSAENKYGNAHQEYQVRVTYPPKMISNVYILAANTTGLLPYKESVNINCSVIASPNISITWIRKLTNYNEKSIENDTEKYFITENHLKGISGIGSILYIRNFQNDDYGRYLCIAKNSEGHIETNYDIRKFSIPDPAHDLVVDSRTWNSLSLRWKAGFDGGYQQVFTVTYATSTQKHPLQKRTIHSNITLNYLLPDVLYTVNISSSNDMGTGASTLSIKTKTADLIVDGDQIFTVNRNDRTIEFTLPSNLTSSIFCLTVEQMDIQKDLVGDWVFVQKCMKTDVKRIRIENPNDRFRVKICLTQLPDVCSGPINQRLDSVTNDNFVSTKLIGTVAAICTILVILLAILLFVILIRSRRFLPGISDLKVIKRNRKSSFSKDDNSNFNMKSTTPICHKKPPFIKEAGVYPLLNTYSCDQVHINGNPIEILNVCPSSNVYMESLYSTLVKSSSISPFSNSLHPSGDLNPSTLNNISSCCCHDDQQVFTVSPPASKTNKPEKIFYEVMV